MFILHTLLFKSTITGRRCDTTIKKHSLRQQKIIEYRNTGKIKEKIWCKYKGLHRCDGPAYVSYYNNGNIKSEYWYKFTNAHRNDGPARLEYYANGNIKEESWYENGKEHRPGGAPFFISYYENNNIKTESWFKYIEEHHIGALSIITRFENFINYLENGQTYYCTWYKN